MLKHIIRKPPYKKKLQLTVNSCSIFAEQKYEPLFPATELWSYVFKFTKYYCHCDFIDAFSSLCSGMSDRNWLSRILLFTVILLGGVVYSIISLISKYVKNSQKKQQ